MKLFRIISNIQDFIIDELNSRKRDKQLLEFIKSEEAFKSLVYQISSYRTGLHYLKENSNAFPKDDDFTYRAYKLDKYLIEIYKLIYGYKPKPSNQEPKQERIIYVKPPKYDQWK
ncbi:hypothetical protein E4T25_08935 [Photobacterium damselae subsp. piscicida]|uniref:hypothetical protein n=1 Tax=Photobacterium damselae TaxID=38293 RepID=UPI0010767BE0|nr:hypothetical protein [Photobacterium damselae]TFZ60117.1 hypothetical protein E4T25_08935 [Photobacterium damselae subsp. piscicida]